MATGVTETRPASLDSSSEPPSIFDGKTKLYINYECPYAQRVWISRNYKGLQDKIKLIPIDLKNRPAWYKEKVYPPNKVPCLEHNNEVKGESLDLLKYLEANFDGPSLLPDDPSRREFVEELLAYSDTFNRFVKSSFKEEDTSKAGAAFDYFETSLGKFNDGPFFLGSFSLVDIAYMPFVERFQAHLWELKQYDLTEGRPKLAAWIQNAMDALIAEQSLTKKSLTAKLSIRSHGERQTFISSTWKTSRPCMLSRNIGSDKKIADSCLEINKIEAYKETKI